MRISIIIPNYNGKQYLKACISSIMNSCTMEYQILIVDNNSIDKSKELVTNVYNDVCFIELDKNYGFAKAVNEGIKLSKGEYVILLNNDTEVEMHWLENLVKAIESNSKIFSVCSKMVQFNDRNLIDDAGDEYTLFGWTSKRGDGQGIENYTAQEEIFSSCAGSAIYRKSVFEEIGYFDEHFFAYMEDVDISYRARIHGYKNVYCPDSIVYHVGSGTSGSKYNEFKVKLAARNNVYVPYKNMPILQLLINLPFLFIGFLIKYIFFLKKGFGKIYLDGIIEGITTLDKVEKVKFKKENIINYLRIQYELIKNTFKYALSIIRRKI